MINACVHIRNPTYIDVVMGNVDQSFEINEHITFKRGLAITEHVIHIPFIDLHYCYEITDKHPLIVKT
jgi:hypothetical protein